MHLSMGRLPLRLQFQSEAYHIGKKAMHAATVATETESMTCMGMLDTCII